MNLTFHVVEGNMQTFLVDKSLPLGSTNNRSTKCLCSVCKTSESTDPKHNSCPNLECRGKKPHPPCGRKPNGIAILDPESGAPTGRGGTSCFRGGGPPTVTVNPQQTDYVGRYSFCVGMVALFTLGAPFRYRGCFVNMLNQILQGGFWVKVRLENGPPEGPWCRCGNILNEPWGLPWGFDQTWMQGMIEWVFPNTDADLGCQSPIHPPNARKLCNGCLTKFKPVKLSAMSSPWFGQYIGKKICIECTFGTCKGFNGKPDSFILDKQGDLLMFIRMVEVIYDHMRSVLYELDHPAYNFEALYNLYATGSCSSRSKNQVITWLIVLLYSGNPWSNAWFFALHREISLLKCWQEQFDQLTTVVSDVLDDSGTVFPTWDGVGKIGFGVKIRPRKGAMAEITDHDELFRLVYALALIGRELTNRKKRFLGDYGYDTTEYDKWIKMISDEIRPLIEIVPGLRRLLHNHMRLAKRPDLQSQGPFGFTAYLWDYSKNPPNRKKKWYGSGDFGAPIMEYIKNPTREGLEYFTNGPSPIIPSLSVGKCTALKVTELCNRIRGGMSLSGPQSVPQYCWYTTFRVNPFRVTPVVSIHLIATLLPYIIQETKRLVKNIRA